MSATCDEGGVLPLVSIVLLNYRNWGDTIECLESLLRLEYPQFEIIVCDNDSQDGSVEHICAWARGEVVPALRHAAVASQRRAGWTAQVPHELLPVGCTVAQRRPGPIRLFILPTGRNGGFSAGNNLGMRFAMAHAGVGCIWLLNNDTVVAPTALSRMVAKLRADPRIGICGARLLNFEKPYTVQALGGSRYTRWRGRGRMLLPSKFPGLNGAALIEAVEREMGYVIGASMLVPRTFIEQVGFLSEVYFLYFEEIDWVRRAKRQYRLGYCDEAVVYHRQGSSTGEAENSEFSAFHLSRSRVRFVAQFDQWALPTVYLQGLWDSTKARLQGRVHRARGIFRGLCDMGPIGLLALKRQEVSGGLDRVVRKQL